MCNNKIIVTFEQIIIVMNKRNAFTIYVEDDMAITFMKPLSEEHREHLLKVYEDAYGDMKAYYMPIHEIIDSYEENHKNIREIINNLDEAFENIE